MDLYQRLVELTTRFPLQLAAVMHQGEEAIMSLWREFCAQALSFVPIGRFGMPLFNQLNRLRPSFTVAFPLLKKDLATGKQQVLLRLRKEGEVFPGLWGVEASAINAGEIELDVIKRLLVPLGCQVEAATELYHARFYMDERQGERGSYFHLPFHVETSGLPQLKEGDGRQWWDIDALPDMVPHHLSGVLVPVMNYLGHRELYQAGEFLTRQALSGRPEEVDQTELRRQIAVAAQLLQGRFLGAMYSSPIGQCTTHDSLELGIVRRVGEVLQGYMHLRDSTNPRYPHEWHFPGLQQLPGEEDGDTIRRGILNKYPGLDLKGDAVFVRRLTPSKENYAREAGGLHINANLWLVVGDNSHLPVDETYGWFPLDNLPENTVFSHRDDFVPIFREAFLRCERGNFIAVREVQVIYNLDKLRG